MVEASLILVILALLTFSVESYFVSRAIRSPVVTLNFLLAPFWTILGAISILLTKRESAAKTATYLERELFVIVPDRAYLQSLVGYSVFLVLYPIGTYLIYQIAATKTRFNRPEWRRIARSFPHRFLAAEVLVFVAVALALTVRKQNQMNTSSLYLAPTGDIDRWVNYLSVGIAVGTIAGFSLLVLDGWRNILLNKLATIGYFVATIALVYVNWSFGRRNLMVTFVVGLVLALWVYGNPTEQAKTLKRGLRWAALLLVAATLLFLTAVAGVTRGTAAGTSWTAQLDLYMRGLTDFSGIWITISKQGEWFASHMSLYGVISTEADWGGQFSLPYSIYAVAVDAPQGVGYTIHPVAAWWLYVGPFAPVIAAAFLAGASVACVALSRCQPSSFFSFAAIPAGTLAAFGIPAVLLRGGPDGIWGLSLMVIVLPGLILAWPIARARARAVPYDTR